MNGAPGRSRCANVMHTGVVHPAASAVGRWCVQDTLITAKCLAFTPTRKVNVAPLEGESGQLEHRIQVPKRIRSRPKAAAAHTGHGFYARAPSTSVAARHRLAGHPFSTQAI